MKKYILLLLLLICLLPIKAFAISDKYEDKIAQILEVKKEDNKINLYLFHGKECPHCEEERNWLDSIKEDYDDLNIYDYEVWHNDHNKELMNQVKETLNINTTGIPLTIIGNDYYVGFSDTSKSIIQNKINEYLEIEDKESINIPILGKVNARNVSLPLVAVILGFIDGFNPCAMWILLFLISMLFDMKDRKRAWILGLTFLFISGIVYFLSMLGMNFVLGIATIKWMKILIALFILGAGIFNLINYIKTRKQANACKVVSHKKRSKIITRIKNITSSKSFLLSMVGIIVLAASVNLIELACSLGFPLIYTELLTINNIEGFMRILCLVIYILFYMIDDMIIFAISMITIEATGITNKYSKLCSLVSALIMIAMGLLLLIKPEWLMLNF